MIFKLNWTNEGIYTYHSIDAYVKTIAAEKSTHPPPKNEMDNSLQLFIYEWLNMLIIKLIN